MVDILQATQQEKCSSTERWIPRVPRQGVRIRITVAIKPEQVLYVDIKLSSDPPTYDVR